MNVEVAAPTPSRPLRSRFTLPSRVPRFGKRAYLIFSVIWVAALLLAIGGPIAGLYDRYTSPSDNSQLVLGSRAGFAVSPQDATEIRFAVGPHAREAGIRAGDDILAIYGLPLPARMPVTERALAAHADDPAYIAMGNLLFGTEQLSFPLTVRSADGRVHDITVTTGEQHIDAAARAGGVAPVLLSFIDLIHVIFYPFLIWAAWILHRRNSRDVVSSILSLAILLMIGAELPSSAFLAGIGVPHGVHAAVYDVGNVLLIAGILLFPHGQLSLRVLVLLALAPVLMLLRGQFYQVYFLLLMLTAVMMQASCLKISESIELKQQIRWALLGFAGFALFRGVSYGADVFKWSAGSFPAQLGLEATAGLTFGLSMLILQLGLLVALVRYRLYDAEFVISRSANFALITLVVAAVFAGAADAFKQVIYNYYGNTNSEGPVVIAAALATVLINPIQDRIQRWSERKFQKNLVLLRDDLPDCVRDMRETASLTEMLDEILARVDRGVRAVRSAAIVGGRVLRTRDVSREDVDAWKGSATGANYASDLCEPSDKLFPIRVPLVPSSDDEGLPIGFLLVGPRPDGSIPSRDEQKALSGVSESIARAIRTVIRREAREGEVARLIEANAQRIETLEAAIAARGPKTKRRPGTA